MSAASPPAPGATQAQAASGAPRPGAGQRLVSLDALRAFTMFWLLGGKPSVMAVARLGLGRFSTATAPIARPLVCALQSLLYSGSPPEVSSVPAMSLSRITLSTGSGYRRANEHAS